MPCCQPPTASNRQPPTDQVLTLVDQLTTTATADKPWRVYVTGHSLGGALATLFAYEVAGRRYVWL
jgi:poly(3-hydroxybutyrate) depolymerase